MKNYKWHSLIWAVLLSCSFFSVSQVDAADSKSTVKIGILLPLSGDLAHVGTDIQRGMELAIAEVREQSGSVSYELIYEDDGLQIKNAVSGAKKLLEVDRVDLLVALWNMADPVAPLAEQQKIPLLGIRWNPHLTEKYKYAITLESTYLTYSKSQVDLLRALNVKNISQLVEENQGWLLAADALRKYAAEQNITIITDDNYMVGQSDFLPLVSKVLRGQPQVIIINGFQPALGLLIRKIKEKNPNQLVMAYLEIVDPKEVAGMPFVAQYEATPWFKAAFRKRYGEDFTSRAAHGYDVVKLIDSVYNTAGKKVSSEDFLSAISQVKNFNGATGKLTSNANRNIENEPVWQIAKDGAFVPLTKEMIETLKFPE